MKALLERIPCYNQLVLPYHFAQSVLASVKYHFPAHGLHVIGVTGTNGKTSTCFMIWQMLNHAGLPAGLLTTVAWGYQDLTPELGHMTTVDTRTLNRRIRTIRNQGAKYLVIEVTSHALAEFRTLNIPFEIAVFTNLTHEHLDYHKTMSRYRAAKGKLFKKATFSIINADDSSASYYEHLSRNYLTYGIKSGQIQAKDIQMDAHGIKYSLGDISTLNINTPPPTQNLAKKSVKNSSHDIIIETKIPGEFNVYNSLAAAAAGLKLGLSPAQIHDGIYSLNSVEGRMNLIDEGQPFTVIVDYAHAPDALEKVFHSVQSHQGRVISVHGGAGRRDPSTRPIRGEILGRHSDIVIITEDDSRDEDPAKIAEGFLKGAQKAGKVLGHDLFLELNRKKAIQLAFSQAKKGDLVLILGKGHEKTILRADGPHPFEDAKVARALLKNRA